MVISEVFTPEDQISFVMRCQGANFMIVRIFSGLQISIFVLETRMCPYKFLFEICRPEKINLRDVLSHLLTFVLKALNSHP